MSISTSRRRNADRGFVPKTALANGVEFSADSMHVYLIDGRVLAVPIIWFPRLRNATPEQLTEVEIGGGGIGLHWPSLDEDISVANLMAGADYTSA